MGRKFLKFVLFLFGTLIMDCGGSGGAPFEPTPLPIRGSAAEPVSPPSQRFKIPVPNLEWIPASVGSGLGEDFQGALRDRRNVAVILPTGRTDALMEDRVFQMLKKAAPNTKIVARGTGVLDKLLEERGEIPYRVTLEPGGTDGIGRPYYLPENHPLNTDWLESKKPLNGAEALLTVRRIRVDDQKLREMRRRQQGGCEDMVSALENALNGAPDYFGIVESASLDMLADSFVRHLEVALPFWRDELVRAGKGTEPGSLKNRCVEAYRVFLKGYEPCLGGPCPIGPKIYSTGRGIVAMVDTSQLIPEGCSLAGIRDYATEIEKLGTRAVAETLSSLDNGWPGEFLRYGGLEQIHHAMKRFCVPRHRRIHEEDLEKIDKDVHDFLEKIGKQKLRGKWQSAGGMERASYVGPVHVLARVQATGPDPVEEAGKIGEKMRGIERCTGEGENLFQAALIDVESSEVHFMGIFFEEELLCDGFQPGFP